jgi:redox-sensing transcriptional repressor
MPSISEKTIGRLSVYRRLLEDLLGEGKATVRSRELATLARSTAAQVRRDLMVAVGCQGRPNQGYRVADLLACIGTVLDAPDAEAVALVGVGNLGSALLRYLTDRRPKLSVTAAFDRDPRKIGRVVNGCPCYAATELPQVVMDRQIRVGIIAVPAAGAQEAATLLVNAGVRSLLNFAPVRLHVPEGVFVEDIDISTSLEKAAYFARQRSREEREAACT